MTNFLPKADYSRNMRLIGHSVRVDALTACR